MSLFINYPYLFLVNMINWWGFTLTDYKRGVLDTGQVIKGGSYARVRLDKRGVLGTGQVKNGGYFYCGSIPVLAIYVSAPPPGILTNANGRYP